ncbi:MAG TPA: bifunctional DNA-formamidopyrimidine glycosylase/DNA-(apurinic or apyrimidinic site) lyase [Aquabacterium sp.]|nr:bifunctional DNA-formamidopyrimidine glycosylase/DNA-(apurinic or apyrimidinic site) lyase [Aquabacterium sp.]
MPELPEVEVTRQSFASRIQGATVRGVFLGKPLRWPMDVEPEQLTGARVGEVVRRGKYLWLPLDGGAQGRGGLLIHLGMSGSLAFATELPGRGGHDHFELITSQGTLRLTDPRRFGAVVWSPGMEVGRAAKLLSTLGMEPFDPKLTPEFLHQRWKGRTAPVKQAVLAGDVVVGAGNIYACEALFLSGIDPRVPAGRLSKVRCGRLLEQIQHVLGEAVKQGGTSLRDFKDSHGAQGHFQLSTHVYGREGLPCRICTTPITRIVQGQRATFYCRHCQKR